MSFFRRESRTSAAKKIVKAYLGWKGFKGAAKVAAGAAAGYGLLKLLRKGGVPIESAPAE